MKPLPPGLDSVRLGIGARLAPHGDANFLAELLMQELADLALKLPLFNRQQLSKGQGRIRRLAADQVASFEEAVRVVGTITEHQTEDGNPLVKVAHGEFVREAHAAVHLDGFMADVPGLLADEGACGCDVGLPVGTFRRRRELQETHGLLDAGIAINDPVLQDLESSDWLAELLASPQVFRRHVEQRLHAADRFRAHRRIRVGQRVIESSLDVAIVELGGSIEHHAVERHVPDDMAIRGPILADDNSRCSCRNQHDAQLPLRVSRRDEQRVE